jgi:hypothetical protein
MINEQCPGPSQPSRFKVQTFEMWFEVVLVGKILSPSKQERKPVVVDTR